MGKTVEQIYQKKSQHEHILTRPDMYIGTIESVTDDMWVYDEADAIMKQRKCTWIPGLYKIFDEILVNASDNKVRDPFGQTVIKVWIDEHSVRVYNNGEGIPVQKHRQHDLWVPEMIFGHLLTSSNYDDSEAKVTGGRNGFGAKLTNVFSTRFDVETVHSRSHKKFYMRWTKNMLQHDEPLITSSEGPDYTMVTFFPDFARFHVEKFSEDMILMMKRRVYDVAGCTDKSLKCYLNGERISISNFAEYVDLYPTMGEEKHKHSYARVNERWEVVVRVSNIGFQQMSFVNSIATTRGGTHVKYILDQIIAKVMEKAMKRNKTEVKPHMVRPHIFLFVNCLIENPGFDSQTKETLNTVRSKFGSTCEIPSTMIDYILRSSIVERSIEMANSKLTKEMASKLKASDRKQILGIPKLDDANEAGGKYGFRCTLILTEGDSAKTLCTAGLAVKDRDFFGVFPLRGKPLNVRDASLKKVTQCEEIQSVMKIMGLDIRQKDTTVDMLRYGHLMIMSDQDHDGSHIKGLIINMIQCFWPGLLRIPGFMQQFITPIVKARPKGRGGENKVISFFSIPDYFEWKQSVGDRLSDYEIRYYKGLGTSGSKEGREYFENIERHRLDFVGEGPEDEDRICMAFAKDRVEERKEWITNYKANMNAAETMDYNVRKVSYRDFVDKELILFSIADCERSIPSAIDGFKPGQRKILFSCFKRNLTRSIKVVQLAGYVSEHSAYHHGEISLVQTIVAMAQDFVGSNNVPLLQQDGQFGTRLQGGKDHAAGRYIFTRLSPIARCIFHPADDYVVAYKDDDGLSVEPFHYVPILPMALINGTSGIGTGFSTNIPSYNPIEIIDNLKRLIRGENVVPLQPWYFGFTGSIEEKEKGKFISHGRYQIRSDGVVCITELPVNVWTQNYKKFLEDLREKEVVVQYREHNTDVSIDFEVFVHPQILQLWREQNVVEERLQLRDFIHATNIIAFNREGQLTKYLDAESLLREFYLIRLEYYTKRKDYLLGDLRRTTSKLENMARFVREVVAGQLVVTRRKKKELLQELQARQYMRFPPQQKKKVTATTIEAEEDGLESGHVDNGDDLPLLFHNDRGGADDPLAAQRSAENTESPEVRRASRDYDYLLGMKLWCLTAEMIARLEAQLQRAKHDIELLEKLTPKELWVQDLDLVRPKLLAYFADCAKEIETIQRKKMEKKKSFDTRRLRVPLLSDKARQALMKESGKLGGGGRTTQPSADAASVNINGKPPSPPKPSKKPRARRKRRRKDSDGDDNDSIDSSFSSSEGDSENSIVGMGDDEATLGSMREKARQAASRQGATGTRNAFGKKSNNAAPSAKKGRVKKEASKPLAPRSSALENTVATDSFDLDKFGLDALSSVAVGASDCLSSATTAKPGSSREVAHKPKNEDDLALRGIALSSPGADRVGNAAPGAVTPLKREKPAAKSRAAKPREPVSTNRKDRVRRKDSEDDDSGSTEAGSSYSSTDDDTSETTSSSSTGSDDDFSD